MKPTLNFDDRLIREAKARADRDGETLTSAATGYSSGFDPPTQRIFCLFALVLNASAFIQYDFTLSLKIFN